jgi:hypothetical protein
MVLHDPSFCGFHKLCCNDYFLVPHELLVFTT